MEYRSVDASIDEVFDDALSSYEFETVLNPDNYAGEHSYDGLHFLVHPGCTAEKL